MLVVRGVGLQRTSRFALCGSRTNFMPVHDIEAVIVNEGITRCNVRYYLALVIARRQRMELLFEQAQPRLHILSDAYRTINKALYHENSNRTVKMQAS